MHIRAAKSMESLSDVFEDRANRRARIPEYIAAASSGDIDAQLTLAWEYARGDVLDQNILQAWDWFDRAAASGQEEALAHRARFLQLRHVPEGVRELRKLAAAGHWKAQFWLARHYQSRVGRFSQLRAVVWLDRSSRSGGASAAKLAKLGIFTKIAPLHLKPVFLSKAIIEAITMVWRMMWHDENIETYQSLMYQLKRRDN
jgi:TPR repeat protein